MNLRSVDVAIIGSGTAGMSAYRAALAHTDSIVMIEAGAYGTTCARVGCMPSKLLIAAADAAHAASHSGQFGVKVGSVDIDGKAVMARVQRERDRFVGFVLESVAGFDAEHLIRGHARFEDAHTLVIDQHTRVTAKRIVIASGSRPNVPEILKAAEDRLLINDDIFELEDLPSSVVVFGTGVIGLELGQALSRLGVKVSVLGRGETLGGLQDPEIKTYAANTFSSEFNLQLNTRLQSVVRNDAGVSISYLDQHGNEVQETFDYLLAATGRQANIDQLSIERSGLQLDRNGVPIFNRTTQQAGESHIFIAGDAVNELPLLHEAADEGAIAGGNAGSFPLIKATSRRAPLAIVFSEPQIASVGMNWREVTASHQGRYIEGQVSFDNQGRSRVMGKNKGRMKVYAEHRSGRFLGAEIFGPAAEHIGHLLAWAVQQQLSVDDILAMPFYHPVVEEGVRSAFRDASSKLKLQNSTGCSDMAAAG